jgi:hypothetical protein
MQLVAILVPILLEAKPLVPHNAIMATKEFWQGNFETQMEKTKNQIGKI